MRPGDRGPQVAELQNRLREIGRWLYSGPSDGDYTDRVAYSVAYYQSYMGVHGDPTGVYGPNTRKLLEAQTSGRDRDHGRGHGRGHR
ncbi:peptidoglycan-binding domain-containing protein [Streptomyces sp. SID10692]|uniref:peptidoglycan-binding domain-containing protein n=1 Tax=Streptomyces sp. SID10692 TaxID=2706026 RepID=UPI0031B9FCDF